MPSISPFITYETLHCVHQHKIKDASTSNPQNDGFNDGVPKKIAGFARVIKLEKTCPGSLKNLPLCSLLLVVQSKLLLLFVARLVSLC